KTSKWSAFQFKRLCTKEWLAYGAQCSSLSWKKRTNENAGYQNGENNRTVKGDGTIASLDKCV
ncbi:unnamed protein product, partial [Musa hybrid cultivar]